MEHGNWKEMYEAAVAGDVELVRHLIGIGVDVNFIHPEFMSTALVSCIVAGQSDVAMLLIDCGADPALVSPWEEVPPLQAARSANLTDVTQRLERLLAEQNTTGR